MGKTSPDPKLQALLGLQLCFRRVHFNKDSQLSKKRRMAQQELAKYHIWFRWQSLMWFKWHKCQLSLLVLWGQQHKYRLLHLLYWSLLELDQSPSEPIRYQHSHSWESASQRADMRVLKWSLGCMFKRRDYPDRKIAQLELMWPHRVKWWVWMKQAWRKGHSNTIINLLRQSLYVFLSLHSSKNRLGSNQYLSR